MGIELASDQASRPSSQDKPSSSKTPFQLATTQKNKTTKSELRHSRHICKAHLFLSLSFLLKLNIKVLRTRSNQSEGEPHWPADNYPVSGSCLRSSSIWTPVIYPIQNLNQINMEIKMLMSTCILVFFFSSLHIRPFPPFSRFPIFGFFSPVLLPLGSFSALLAPRLELQSSSRSLCALLVS